MAVKVEYQGVYKEYHVHHLVAAAFLESPQHGHVLYHKNGMIRDNYAGNLEFIDRNSLARKTGGKSARCIPVVQIDLETGEIINFYNSIGAAARDNYISKETICQAVRGTLKTAAGYKWRRELADEAI